jgi:death-on-curing protein
MKRSGGALGVRDLGGLESALAQPRMTYGGEEFYPEIGAKAATLAYSLIMNHPFVDGNKRLGHAAMEVFLVLNGFELHADDDEQESAILNLAASRLSREEFTIWVQGHIRKIN